MTRAAFLLPGLTLLCAAIASAQGPLLPPSQSPENQSPATAKKPPKKDSQKSDKDAPLGETPAEEIDKNQDPARLLGGDDATGGIQAPDYTGPSILTRGFALTRPVTPTNDTFQPFLGVNASYDSGQVGAYAQNVRLPAVSIFGADFNWGISGRHYRRKDIFELSYTGHYYQYQSSTQYGGQDHALSMGYTRQLTSRFTLGLREVAGLYSNTYSVLNSTALADTSLASSSFVVAPNTEAFDDRTYYSTTEASVIYHKSERLSFSAGGTFFLVRRDSPLLADLNGYQTSFDTNYRLTKRQTVGVYYTHSGFTFRKQFGNTNANSFGGTYAIALTRNTDLSIRAGLTAVNGQILGAVTPNPLVQAVLGISQGVEKQTFTGYAPDLTITLTRRLKRSTMGATFIKGITPGNGLVLTSSREGESLFYALPTFSRYAVQIGAGRDVLGGYLNSPGNYTSYYGRISLSHPVGRNLSAVTTFDYRQFGFGQGNFHQNENRLTVGLRYSPEDRPLNFW